MDDYIKRDDVIEECCDMLKVCFDLDEEILDAIVTTIKEIPAASVRESMGGRWIPIKEMMLNGRTHCYEEIATKYRCTRCGTVERDAWKYCRCGAVMENGNCHPLCNTGDRR